MGLRATRFLNGFNRLNSDTCSALAAILRKVFDRVSRIFLSFITIPKIPPKENLTSNISVSSPIIIHCTWQSHAWFQVIMSMNWHMEHTLQNPSNLVVPSVSFSAMTPSTSKKKRHRLPLQLQQTAGGCWWLMSLSSPALPAFPHLDFPWRLACFTNLSVTYPPMFWSQLQWKRHMVPPLDQLFSRGHEWYGSPLLLRPHVLKKLLFHHSRPINGFKKSAI